MRNEQPPAEPGADYPSNFTANYDSMNEQQQIENFLDGKRFAVVGASQDRSKYGNKVLRVYQQNGMEAIPVNPNAHEVEGAKAYPNLASIPGEIHGVSIITPPPVTERVVNDAIQKGIQHIWMQPGAENETAISAAESAGASVIAGGPCILVSLHYRGD
jgi:predicted CoA-binding protein